MLTRSSRLAAVFSLLMLMCIKCPASASAGESAGQVWQVGERRWNAEQEQRFADWLEQNVTDDFFIRYKISVDCADVPYALRWIYARIARLPAAVTAADGQLLGHWSTAWSHLPTAKVWYKDRRFRQSLLTVLESTSTKTLSRDTYPIRIAPGSLAAGTIFLYDGHAGIVGRIVLDGSTYSPVQTWEATLPRRVTRMFERNFFGSGADLEAGTGLLRFRWPVFVRGRWQYLPEKQHPYYSLEQYSPNFAAIGESFDQAVARRIDPKQYEPAQRARLMIDALYRYLLDRVPLVRTGYNKCRQKQCRQGSALWEEYSTPGRDGMIDLKVIHLQRLIHDNGLDEEKFAAEMRAKTIPIDDGRMVTVQDMVENHEWLSHDPNDSIEARWGLTRCEIIRERVRSAYADLDFVENRYRDIDPDYIDRRREYTANEVRWLRGQGRDSGCKGLQTASRESSSPHTAVSSRAIARPPAALPIRTNE